MKLLALAVLGWLLYNLHPMLVVIPVGILIGSGLVNAYGNKPAIEAAPPQAALPPPPEDDYRIECVTCAELVKHEAKKCRFCGHVFVVDAWNDWRDLPSD
jgi:hypothetical protein